MLRYAAIAVRSAKVVVVLLIVDVVAAFLPFPKAIEASRVGVIGDLLLVEVALLFIIAGVLDFASSIGMTQFRRVILSSKEEYSAEKRKRYEKVALVYVVAGVILLLVMVLLMVYDNLM